MPDSNPSRALVIVEWCLLAALAAVFVASGFLPAWRTMNTDFPNYFLPASLHRQGISIDRAYEWRWFQRYKDYAQIDQTLVGFAPHPPMCAAPLLPLTGLPSLSAKRAWLILGLILLAISLVSLRSVTEIGWRRLLLLAFLCIVPLQENFLFGQYYVVILTLLCLAYYAACRGHHFTSGATLAAAASLKIFPVFFLILFLRKRNWRAAAGVIAGCLVFVSCSVALFGWSVHKVLLLEVLPRALRGDMVSPYVLQWNSFTALCHRLFLAEPELNPTPLFASVSAYAMVQALISTSLLFSFLFSTGDEETPSTRAWEWSTFVALLLLMSSMPTAYHHCALIFTVIVAVDSLLKRGARGAALAAVAFYALACSPMPDVVRFHLQTRLLSVFLLVLLLLYKAPARLEARYRRLGFALAMLFLAMLAASNFRAQRNRSEDFSRRLPPVSAGYGTFTVARAGNHIVLDEMVADAYGAVVLPEGARQSLSVPGDVLSIAAGTQSPFIYFELATQHSRIFRLPVEQLGNPGAVPEYVAEGFDPAISADGRRLAFLREENARTQIFMMDASRSNDRPFNDLRFQDAPVVATVAGSDKLGGVLEMTVTANGDVIAAAGSAADPHLSWLKTASGEVRALSEIRGAVRYPAISPNGKMLAFSRRESGAWHLFVRELESGREQQLTTAACNATSPSWEDARTLLYVSDCGRGLALGAPARVKLQ